MNILETIAEKTVERIAEEKKYKSPETVRREAEEAAKARTPFLFAEALKKPEISFICEVKKASPSKGIIAEDFPYLDIAKEYDVAGASCISCLTEPYWFLGKDAYLKEIVQNVSIPVLRKDFTIDDYMIYQASAMNASAVLLICSILDDGQLKAYGELAAELGLTALVEAHTETEIERALKSGAGVIGVNNRNLKNFDVKFDNCLKLRKMVPDDIVFVAESGIQTPEDVKLLRENGTDAVLIGETFMRAPDKKAMLQKLKG